MVYPLDAQVRRIVHYKFGAPGAVLKVDEAPGLPPLRPGFVRVRVSHSIIHPGDLQLVAAKYSENPPEISEGRVPGSEAVGVIVDGAPDVLRDSGLTIGARVTFLAQSAWQSVLDVAADALVGVPAEMPDEVATQLLVNTITARHVMRKALAGSAESPEPILLTAAASAVGKLITIEARRRGLDLIRLVRSPSSAKRLAEILPGEDIVETSGSGWQSTLRRMAGGEIPLAIDGVGGAMVGHIGRLLKTQGIMVSFGLLDGGPADLTMFLPKGLSVIGATIGTWKTDTSPEDQAGDLAAAIEIARQNPRVFEGYQTLEMNRLSEAVEAVGAPSKTGNVILKF